MSERADENKRRRTAIINAVKLFLMDNGYWPSVMDIARETNLPESSTRGHVMMLVEQGVLKIAAGDRGITLGLPDVNENVWRNTGGGS